MSSVNSHHLILIMCWILSASSATGINNSSEDLGSLGTLPGSQFSHHNCNKIPAIFNVAYLVEDCEGIETEVQKQYIGNYTKSQCHSGIAFINKVCDLMLTSKKLQIFTSCQSVNFLHSFLNTMSIKHEIQYKDKCDSRPQNYHKKSLEFPKPFMNFILFALKYFKLQNVVILIDSYTGISAPELQTTISTMNIGVTIINADKKDEISAKLKRRNRFQNFILACGDEHLKHIVKHSEEQELFNFPYFWLIITENATHLREIMKSVKVDFTWNIKVAEAMHNYEETTMSHLAVLTEISILENSEIIPSINEACITKNFPKMSKPKTVNADNPKRPEKNISYTLYNFRVVCLGEIATSIFANWTENSGLVQIAQNLSNNLSLKGCNFTIALAIMPPYVYLNPNSNSSHFESTIIGIDIEILKIVASILQFRYQFILTNYSSFGQKLDNGSWTGLFKTLVEDESVNFILPSVSVTPQRSESMYFTSRLVETSASVMIKTPSSTADIDDYIQPFSSEVWFILMVTILIVSIFLTLTYLISPYGQVNDGDTSKLSWYNSVYISSSAMLQQGVNIQPRYISGRIIFATIFATSVLIIQSYSSLLISFLTTNVPKVPFRSVKDLAENEDYSIGLIKETNLAELLHTSTNTNIQQLWKKISSNQDNFVESFAEGVKKVENDKFAFVANSRLLNEIIQKNCSYTAPITNILRSFNCIAMKKHFPYVGSFSTIINRLRETGVLDHVYKQHFSTLKTKCKDEIGHQQIDISNIISLIYLFLAGVGVGILILVLENCLHQYSSWSRNRFPVKLDVPLKQKLKSKKHPKIPNPEQNSNYLIYRK